MQIDVDKIVSDKLAEMTADGTVEKKIRETLEKVVLESITSAIDSYSLRSELRKQIEATVSPIAANCGFDAYNGYLAEELRKLLLHKGLEEAREQLATTFSNVYLNKYQGIKLSEIFEKFRDYANDSAEYDEKRDWVEFLGEIDEDSDGSWQRVTCKFDKDPDNSSSPAVAFGFLEWRPAKSPSTARISYLRIDDIDIGQGGRLPALTDFEALLVNLYFSGTKVILDVDDVSSDTYYSGIDD